MTSLLHQDYPAISDEEAVSYIHDTGPWNRFLLTPWPAQSLIEGAATLAVAIWAGVAVSVHHPWGGIGVGALGLLAAVVIAAPGAYTETHRAYAARYFAALRVHGDHGVRAHPYLVLVLSPILGALVGAFGGVNGTHESATVRIVGAIVGAAFGLAYALVRVRRARQQRPD